MTHLAIAGESKWRGKLNGSSGHAGRINMGRKMRASISDPWAGAL